MILNCAIIDEDPEALQLLEQYIEKTPTLHLIGAYKSAIDAVDGIHHKHLDILFSRHPHAADQRFGICKGCTQEREDCLHHRIQGVCHRSLQSECIRLSAQAHHLR